MQNKWIDFNALRQQLDFAAVLRHYGVELKVRYGEQHQGFCPLPNHQGTKRSPSFSANLKRGIWHCFGCGMRGNLLDFAARMEGLNPESGSDIRQVALLLQQRFLSSAAISDELPTQVRKPPTPLSAAHEKADRAATRPAIVNAPLDFELKGLDSEHPYLKERGFTQETIAHFGLGYCSRGSLQGRIAIPIHDQHGKLVGYAGRVVDDSGISDENPKYKFPGPREREGKHFEFHKSLIVYNGFAAGSDLSDLVVVEGFTSVWWLWQCGFANVVALMGADCSEAQARLLVEILRPDGRFWVFTDTDEAGERCASALLSSLSRHRFVRRIRAADGVQPTDCTPDQLRDLFNCESKGGSHVNA